MPPSALHASTSSRTKCRRLSSRLLPSFSDAAAFLRPFDGGSAAAGVLYQLGAKVPPRAATRHGPTWCGPPLRRYTSVGAGGCPASAAAITSKSSLLPLIQYRGAAGVKYWPSLLATSPTEIHNGTSECRVMMSRTVSNAP